MDTFYDPTGGERDGESVQGLWRLENEALRQGEPLPSLACADPAVSERSWNVLPLHRG